VKHLSEKYYEIHVIPSRSYHGWLKEKIDRDLTNKVYFANIALGMVIDYIYVYTSEHGLEIERTSIETALKQARESSEMR
jgi:hypothetical protein